MVELVCASVLLGKTITATMVELGNNLFWQLAVGLCPLQALSVHYLIPTTITAILQESVRPVSFGGHVTETHFSCQRCHWHLLYIQHSMCSTECSLSCKAFCRCCVLQCLCLNVHYVSNLWLMNERPCSFRIWTRQPYVWMWYFSVRMYYVYTAGSAHLLVCDISLSLPSPTPHSPSSHRSLLTQHLLWEGVVL